MTVKQSGSKNILLDKFEITNSYSEYQKQFWIQKFNNHIHKALSPELSNNLFEIISILDAFEPDKFHLTKDLQKKSIELANILGREDFITLTASVNSLDYLTPQNKCQSCIGDILNMDLGFTVLSTNYKDSDCSLMKN